MFVSRVRLTMIRPRSWRRAVGRFAIDSGGFTELSHHHRWTLDAPAYVAFVREVVERIGTPDFVAPQDHMCEPFILGLTGRSVDDHIAATVDNFCTLRAQLGGLVIPVLQGYGPREYERCAERYAAAGVNLEAEPLVGVGSVCRRSGTREANRLLRLIADTLAPNLHAFGVKGSTWRSCRSFLRSADSMAWSLNARMNGRDGNSLAEALLWRSSLVYS